MKITQTTTTTIYYDLDGTVADLYNTQGWLEAIRSEQPIFESLEPLVDMNLLEQACLELKEKNIGIKVITWLPMDATKEYEAKCAREKNIWVKKNMPYVDEIICLSYGVPKQEPVKDRQEQAILIDDNKEVGELWAKDNNRTWFDANNDIIEFLKTL